MGTRMILALVLAAALPSVMLLGGCETSHSESTKNNWLGGQTHEETTTYRNPDGSISVDHQKQVTR